MFKWLRKKIIKSFIKDFIQEIKRFDVKSKVFNYIKDNEDEIIEKIEETIKTNSEKIVSKIIARFEDKT
jgi:hypothetical protein